MGEMRRQASHGIDVFMLPSSATVGERSSSSSNVEGHPLRVDVTCARGLAREEFHDGTKVARIPATFPSKDILPLTATLSPCLDANRLQKTMWRQ
jgi:hypothetical protein